MTWSYSTDPGSTPKDSVRFLIGDTKSTAQELSDEEILWLLSKEGTPEQAAARAAEILASKYASLVDKTVGALSISASQRFDHFTSLSSRLRATTTALLSAPYAGGISVADKDVAESDTDRVAPSFSRDMMKYQDTYDETEEYVS